MQFDPRLHIHGINKAINVGIWTIFIWTIFITLIKYMCSTKLYIKGFSKQIDTYDNQ